MDYTKETQKFYEQNNMKSQEEQIKEFMEHQQQAQQEAANHVRSADERAQDTDHTDDVADNGQTTIGNKPLEEALNSSPNANQEQQPPQPVAEQGGDTPTPEQGQPEQPQAPVTISADSFKPKKKSYLDPNVEKGFWGTLDSAIDDALKGSSADQIAENMFWAMLEFPLNLISNKLKHDKSEKKRIDDTYNERVATFDKDLGVTGAHKDMAMWACLADHPQMAKHAGKPITKEARRDALRVMQTDKLVKANYRAILSSMCGNREITNGEFDTFVKNGLKAMTGSNTMDMIKNASLNDPIVGQAISTVDLKNRVSRVQDQTTRHRAEQDTLAQNRTTLNRARGENGQQQVNPLFRQQEETRTA